jgi:endonuclease G
VLAVYDSDDMAFVKIAEQSTKGKPQPKPIRLLLTPKNAEPVVVIGYPGDGRVGQSMKTTKNEIFNGIFEVKRLQPGFLKQVSPTLEHDCSTLSGNSGSVVATLQGSAVGLHWGGSEGDSNDAVSADRIDQELTKLIDQ